VRGMGLSVSNPLSGVGMFHGGEVRRLDFFCTRVERMVRGFFLFLQCPGFRPQLVPQWRQWCWGQFH